MQNVNNTFRNETRRAYAFALFASLLPQRATIGNTALRQQVINGVAKQFNMTVASAAATYNMVKKEAVAQGLCEDFGRDGSKSTPTVSLKTVKLVRAKDKAVVAEGITVAEAEELIAKAVKQKKAKLEIA